MVRCAFGSKVWSGGVHLDLRCGQVVGVVGTKLWSRGGCVLT